jgi:hypothetical protein
MFPLSERSANQQLNTRVFKYSLPSRLHDTSRGSLVLWFRFDRPFCTPVLLATPTLQVIATCCCQAEKPELLEYGNRSAQRAITNVKTARLTLCKKKSRCFGNWKPFAFESKTLSFYPPLTDTYPINNSKFYTVSSYYATYAWRERWTALCLAAFTNTYAATQF